MARPEARLCVTVAEDDDDIRAAVTLLLEDAGYAVEALASGGLLLDRLAPAILGDPDVPRPDALVTDVRMPGINGLAMMEGLRANGWRAPIVVMTAFADDDMRKRVARLGAAALIDKPFDPDTLTQTLSSLLAATGEGAAAPGLA
ncbi:MAG: response regulator [Deltaproteobacteria bacterium]|nr:response regulator [Deltaproteobacteria bacterium]